MTVIIPDDNPIRLADPHDTIQEPAYQLFLKMCELYEWASDEWRAKTRKLLEAFIEYFGDDADSYAALVEHYQEALEDARTCRGHAEVEKWLRDDRMARLQIGEKEGV